MLFLYKIKPSREDMLEKGATTEEERIISAHFNYLKELTEKGVVRLAGRTLNDDSSSFGIVIFSAVSEAEAENIMKSDPAVDQNVFQADLFPFRIALQYDRGD